jgi:hypothetical protein
MFDLQSYTISCKNAPFLAKIQLGVFFTKILTFHKLLIYSHLQKSYKNRLKKNAKKDTTYQKNA